VLPRHAYGRPMPVGRYAIDGRHLESGARGAFVAHREAPRIDVAIPRAGAGIVASARPRFGPSGGQGGPGGFGAPGVTGGGSSSRRFGSDVGPVDSASRRFPRNEGAGFADNARPMNGDIAASRRFVPGAAGASPATPRSVMPGQTPREGLGARENTSGMPGASRRFPIGVGPSERGDSGASGMPGASRRFPTDSSDSSGATARSRRFETDSSSPGASGMPGASRRFPVDRGASDNGSTGASGFPGSSGNQPYRRSAPGGSYEPRSYETPRSLPGSSGSPTYQPRSYQSPRGYQSPGAPGASGSSGSSGYSGYSAPRAYESPRSAPRSYDTPRSYESPRTYEAPRSNPRSYDAPRSYEAPRSHESPRSAPRSYESPRSSDSNRSSGSAPRYNPGAGSRRDSAPSSSGSRRRSPQE
jgi:hypothetical protein